MDKVIEFFALKNINLRIKSGDRLGVIGVNGAGKSTLLKVISSIYTPTEGTITIRGNITPMMEIGAGFDPEQTGRENIYLNGSLLGFSPAKMAIVEKEIVEFSRLDEHIAMPVKYYSSGMYIRLAFSIATMAYPEILLLDEILKAGDAIFQEKAYRKIRELIDTAKIVILVSHDLAEIKNLCNRIIVIGDGEIKADGRPAEMIDYYNEMIGINQKGSKV